METLRKRYPRLICCSISGYGDDGPFRDRKAYDLLIQAELGLASVTGGPEAPARVGVSVVDVCTGMNAYEAILEALIARGRTGEGADIRVSMFDSMMEWMAVPMLSTENGAPPRRIGLSHTALAPYGVFQTSDNVPILISIQNDREWATFCTKVLGEPSLGRDPRFASNSARVANRGETDGLTQRCLAPRPPFVAPPGRGRSPSPASTTWRRSWPSALAAPDDQFPHWAHLPSPPALWTRRTRASARCRRWARIPRRCAASSWTDEPRLPPIS